MLGVSPCAPRPRQGSRSPGPSRGRRPARPLPAALQHRPGSAAEDGSVRAEGGVSPPALPAARRGAALGVYRGPAARSPRPPPCALLTSFILSHPRPPTPFPNSDSPAVRWRQRPLPLPWLSRRRAELEKPVRLLKEKTPADPPLSQPLKVQGRRGLAGRADWLPAESLRAQSGPP